MANSGSLPKRLGSVTLKNLNLSSASLALLTDTIRSSYKQSEYFNNQKTSTFNTRNHSKSINISSNILPDQLSQKDFSMTVETVHNNIEKPANLKQAPPKLWGIAIQVERAHILFFSENYTATVMIICKYDIKSCFYIMDYILPH